MPRLRNQPPAYQLHKPSGQARMRHGGKEFWLGRYGSPEGRKKYSRIEAQVAASGEPIPAVKSTAPRCGLSVTELIREF